MATPVLASATSSAPAYTKLAAALPPLLLNFFRRHPPGTFSRDASAPATQREDLAKLAAIPSVTSVTHPAVPSATLEAVKAAHNAANPFLPWRNPVTNAWRPPRYSLRRQADLYKLARTCGVMSLLPHESPRNPELKLERREKAGLRVRGTGVGQKVKGKAWERGLRTKLEAREKAMEGMADLVKQWKQRGHGRGWKKWPK